MDKKLRILIVEDEYLIALSFKKELERLGYEVLEPVATGQRAIEVAGQEHPDMILMDMGLAGSLNGLEAAREIISRYQLPIIIMTGHTDDMTLEQINQLNPVACLIKPILGRNIHSAISTYYKNREKGS